MKAPANKALVFIFTCTSFLIALTTNFCYINEQLNIHHVCRGTLCELRRLEPDPLNLLVNTSVGSKFFRSD